ncbi:MAG: lamin tail domain-containing protein, partial [Planctomycetota bacterium]|nr:lamin tail domain-containing protein [Planctomycetota bacterium]
MSTAPDAGRRASLVALHLLVVLLAAPGLAAQVRINEILASNRETIVDDDGDSSDWVELVNLGAFPVDLTGHGLSDVPTAPRLWTFPGTVIGAGEHLIVWCSGKDRTQPAAVGLADPASPFDPRLVSLQAEWRYLVGAPQDAGPPPDWNLAGFDDSAWARGRPGFGYGDGDDRTAVPQGSGAVFLRHTFSWDPRAELSNLVLQVKYDDGFVAYLNGVRVLSVNFPAGEEPRFGSAATRGHEANSAERFDLSSRLELLQPGDNLIAVALLNRSPTSTDLSFIPELGTVPPVLHTSFRLDRTGESLVLSSPGGEVLDSVEYPSQSTDQSYGRSPDGAGDFVFHLEPSPGEANSGPVSA